ncbi:two-component system sensor histidine kinase NtrB [Tepidibacter formicigenes]|uniref:histidine kinase n=1 Tax=Tepidibacter formicigenes DSM 15518 TaxID=1123349 RepID=A0A1M6T7X8_9FIRM|nr:HAMP domain-containing sensor histidine kinase [Tepidibacter formicigenes]SHK52868.1 Histidine kinase-, DNA gyrase B-, and HSP90-like ATPase [Tepidibacter formicigenes DSM 15518]
MISWGNIGVIGSGKIFALDLMEKYINTSLEKGNLCVFLGNKDLFEKYDINNKDKVVIFEDYNFKYEELEKKSNKICIIATSDWMLENLEELQNRRNEKIRVMNDNRYRVYTFFNIIDFELDVIERCLLLHDKVIFDNQNKRQTINIQEMNNIRFLLKSIQKAKLDNLNLEKNKKNLQILNDSIISLSFENNLDKIIKKTIETVLSITHADYGSITILFNNKKIEKEYSYSNIDMTYSYRIYANTQIVGILTLGYKENSYKGKSDDYVIDVICSSLGDIIYTFKEREEGKILKNSNNKIRYMGELAGGIVHDLNNVFSIIKGYTQLLSINKQAYDIKEYINIIYNGTNEAINKVKNLQDFSRNIKEDKKYICINDIIVKAIETTRPKWENMTHIRGRNINIVLDLNSIHNIFVQESDIREAIVNMILNSVDSMEDGGNIYINSYDEEEDVVVEIIDEGKGIDNEIIDFIFDPFFTTKEKSTGLGLSIVKKNIEANEGKIQVRSVKGKMSKFKIKLPIREENAKCYV